LKGEGNGDFNIQKISGRIQIPRGFEYIKFDVYLRWNLQRTQRTSGGQVYFLGMTSRDESPGDRS
jgi:hypothetical protein